MKLVCHRFSSLAKSSDDLKVKNRGPFFSLGIGQYEVHFAAMATDDCHHFKLDKRGTTAGN
jgi:hypothetical protein